MLNIQEVSVNGRSYRMREPRLRDYLDSKSVEGPEVMILFLSRMLLNDQDEAIGMEAVRDLPLKDFGALSDAANNLMSENSDGPLDQTNGSATASP